MGFFENGENQPVKTVKKDKSKVKEELLKIADPKKLGDRIKLNEPVQRGDKPKVDPRTTPR